MRSRIPPNQCGTTSFRCIHLVEDFVDLADRTGKLGGEPRKLHPL
jgi:hypothetical protein